MKVRHYNDWRRGFAFTPKYMVDTRETIWLEFYWWRRTATREYARMFGQCYEYSKN